MLNLGQGPAWRLANAGHVSLSQLKSCRRLKPAGQRRSAGMWQSAPSVATITSSTTVARTGTAPSVRDQPHAIGWKRGPGCVRLTDVSVVGESPTERKGSHHFHREPCACHREVSGEASVAACAGQAIEPRNRLCRMRRDFPGNRRQHFSAAIG